MMEPPGGRRCYPMSIEDDRRLGTDYDGPVFIWDIDDTYLLTDFSSIKGLARIPLEFAVDKIAIPGMPEILRGIRQGAGQSFAAAPLYFVSSSPPQLRKVLEHKMLLDGVEYDGITSKDWMRTFRQLRPGRLRQQVGFKVCALLEGRSRRPLAREYLFGDDLEQDAAGFSIYARMLTGELAGGEADAAMADEGTKKDDRRCALSLLEALPETRGAVERVFIHLQNETPPEQFERYGGHVVPVRGAGQLGLALYELGLIGAEAVDAAFSEVLEAERLPSSHRDDMTADANVRGLVSKRSLRKLALGR